MVVVGQFAKKPVSLTVTTAQAVVVHLFNEIDDGSPQPRGDADEDGGGEQKKGVRRGGTFDQVKADTA